MGFKPSARRRRREKQTFLRREGVLVAEHDDGPAERGEYVIAASRLGEEMHGADRARQLRRVRSGDAVEMAQAELALAGDDSPDVIEATVDSLQAHNIAAPMRLARPSIESETRERLVEAASSAPDESFSNFAKALGNVGEVETLRRRLRTLRTNPERLKEHPFSNPIAAALTSTASALLRLDADDRDAALAIAELTSHPCQRDRRQAIFLASDTCVSSEGRAAKILWPVILGFMGAEDPYLFLAAASALAIRYPQQVLQRCRSLLEKAEPEVKEEAAISLSGIGPPHRDASRKILIAWLRDEQLLNVELLLGTGMGESFPEEILTRIVKRALDHYSAGCRYRGIQMLPSLPRDAAVQLVEEALADEPDPALRRELEKWTDTGFFDD
jgi:hypothetical protein